MNKKFLFKTWLLLALMVLGVSSAWAKESTLTFTKACGGSGTADDGASWTITSDGSESTYDSAKGIHYGTKSAKVQYIKLSTSSISGTITKVVVNASAASGVSATVDVTIGGSAFGGDAQSISDTATDYTFSGSASGKIIVTVTKPSKAEKALYVKSISVTYSAASSNPQVSTPTFSIPGGTLFAAQDVELSTETEGAAIYYTTNGSNPTKESTLYSTAIRVSSAMTIKAIAVKDGYDDSEIATATYTFSELNAKNYNSGYFQKVKNVSELEEGDAILFVYESGNVAMSTIQNTNNRGVNSITITDDAIYAPKAEIQRIILQKDDDKFLFYAGSGYLYAASSSSNYLRTEETPDNNAKAKIEITEGNAVITFQGTNTRNVLRYNSSSSIFSCYESGQYSFQIYKEVEKSESVALTKAGYATYYAPYALDFNGLEVKAYKAAMVDNNNVVTFTPVTKVPAGAGVLLKADEGSYDVPVTATASALTDNVFVGVANAGETINGNNGNFYVLRDASEGLGFYKVTASTYNLKQGTAYLSLDNALAKNFIDIDNTTSIGLIGASKNDAQMFNLAGQRVGNDYKGIVIVNGKKVIR